MIRASWNHITTLEESLAKLDERVGEYLSPYEEEVNRIDTEPGISRVTAAAIIAEIGVDMNQFPTSDHLFLCGSGPGKP